MYKMPPASVGFEEAKNQRMSAASRNRKGEEMNCGPHTFQKEMALLALSLTLVEPIVGF